MKRSIAVTLAAVALLFPVSAASAEDGGRPITVQMTGAAERPGPGDPDGTGTATFRINPGQSEVCYTADRRQYRGGDGRPYPPRPADRSGADRRPSERSDQWLEQRLRDGQPRPRQGADPDARGLLRQRPQRALPGRRGARPTGQVTGASA